MARMREIGASFDKGYRDDLNYNFGLLEALIGEANGLTDALRQEMLNYINNLQQQINILTGENIDELLARLNDSIQQALTAAQDARTAKTATEEATALASTATELAKASALLADEKANYANEKAVLAQEAADNANQEASNLSQLKIDAVQATQNANTATGNANQATQAAQTATDAINVVLPNVTGLVNLKEWNIETQYKKNNFVTLEGNGYMALRDNKGVKPPSFPVLSNADWAMFVQKGEKGEQGTGVRILGTLPDESALPPLGEPGDAYLINGDLYVWSDTTNDWTNVGTIKGPKGDTGPQGPQGEQGPPGQDADLTEVNQEIANLQQTVSQNQLVVTEHLGHDVLSENGAHGIRYFNGKLEYEEGADWKGIETGNTTKPFTGSDLDNLTKNGTYSIPANTANAPITGKLLVEVVESYDQLSITQKTLNESTNNNTSLMFKRSGTRLTPDGPITWGSDGLPQFNGWGLLNPPLNNTLTSTSTASAATANAVRQLNDKIPIDSGNLMTSLSNGWTTDYSGELVYRKIGNVVYIQGAAKATVATPSPIVLTLPVGYRPTQALVPTTVYSPNYANYYYGAMVTTSGNLQLHTTANLIVGSKVYIGISFVIV